MDIHRLLRVRGKSPEDVLGMILSNRIDMGHPSGGLISAAQFPILIQDILAWQAAATAKAAAGDVLPPNPLPGSAQAEPGSSETQC